MTSAAKHPRKPSSLFLITCLVVLSAALVFSLYGAVTYNSQHEQLTQSIIAETEESAERLAVTLAGYIAAYRVNDYDRLVAHEVRTRHHAALSAIVVQDERMAEVLGRDYYFSGWERVRPEETLADGQPLADDAVRSLQVDSLADIPAARQSFYQAVRPVVGADGDILGQVYVFAHDASLRQRSDALLLQIALSMLALLLVLSLVLILLLRHLFVRPLTRLAQTVAHMDGQSFPARLNPVSPYREISLLTDSISQMLQTIRLTQLELQREHRNLDNIVRGTRAGTWRWNIPSGEVEFNARWAQMLGYTLEELKPHTIDTWLSRVHPADRKNAEQLLEQHFSGKSDFYAVDLRMQHKAGHWIWVQDRGQVARWNKAGEPVEMFGTHMDITDTRRKTEQLELAASVYRNAHEGIMVLSDQGEILDVNNAFTRITGYSQEEAVGQTTHLLRADQQGDEFYRELWHTLRHQGFWSGEVWRRRKNGEIYPELLSISQVSSDQDVPHYVALFSDISAIKAYEDQLKKVAHFDVLTGLPNRAQLFERLGQQISLQQRRRQELALCFIDLDGFKAVNDSFGHDAGDLLLVTIARRLSAVLRAEDILARLGGDEFVAVLPGIRNRSDLQPVLERMLDEVNLPVITPEGETLQVSASIGISLMHAEHEYGEARLLKLADDAMYQAKQQGKNKFCFSQDLKTPA